ncbi:MAG TPA: bifunctional phosphoribosylaminoimidazolecarboxamide formyltransferase/IMP cyclohydrolase [Oscillatoriaceae cyanobacterium M33_DOE_052]|uniref:Bifunctional purine biosynthesis protein PurH n=1 Tax=Planktothricoides sp. SpSt-374 TaxID=2282167 RepID=A0A7C3VN55_9CYAN|nr:bifunctional phosphoribosylaminoimidazolecarboxamide formyltransferase/IMP cyclohydrolase [Oscillatoriaceae cyanobacterium M33_DOE_052]
MARLALVSTSDKTGLVEFARRLVEEFGFDLISSGGTAKTLSNAKLPVMKVSDYTGFPEILGGRVKTLHPRIHGGILGRRDFPSDVAEMEANHIRPIDLVVVNLYPFQETIAKPGVTMAEAIENIDIGGPAMLRAAAKNHLHLTVLCKSSQYEPYLQQLQEQRGEVSLAFRQACAREAFWHTATYDEAIAAYLGNQPLAGSLEDPTLPPQFTLVGKQVQPMRYGENPHQKAAWYQTGQTATGWAAATKVQGKELSYNNLVDLEAARRLISEFPSSGAAAAAILKHNNPCGVALAKTPVAAYQKALASDPVSAFGGIVALNRPIDADTALELTQIFLECVVAPACTPEAAEILQSKSRVRVLTLASLTDEPQQTIKAIAGGFLLQEGDQAMEHPQQWQVVTEKQPTPDQIEELFFAWKVVKHVKSNAIVVTRDRATAGVGAGQMNRVGSAKIALEQAGDKAVGAVLSSDAFFPFGDSVKLAAEKGIVAIVQPGGSLRDQESIDAANELGIVMLFTGIRHFLH